MPTLSKLAHLPDLSMRQMVFFYELCKLGVVRFDLRNQQHKEILNQLINKLRCSNQKEPAPDKEIKRQLFGLIMFQILKYVIPEEQGGD